MKVESITVIKLEVCPVGIPLNKAAQLTVSNLTLITSDVERTKHRSIYTADPLLLCWSHKVIHRRCVTDTMPERVLVSRVNETHV